jgi:hypothetical protein
MPTYNTGNPQRTLTAEQPDGMPTSRNMTMKSNMSLEKPTYQQIHCHDPQAQTKARTITKML